MNKENIFTILERNNLSCDGFNYGLYEEFSKTIESETEIIHKITEYNNYAKNNNNKYSDEIMQYLRQRNELNKFDFSQDKELNELSSNKVFEEIVKWNGLLGCYSETIKSWVKEIYGVDLNEIEK
ncbi:hypothetical protein [Alkaliphilus sp. B6464]|uniref:hypothetical protein n=1 Tax=Alkaliphilus sp. B6464 TaxID=2731219 RepID=UPI001BABBFBB|nr:hypothetical protein [Alkaliphilus sp. B6464]QUH21833.1 hypothetical protein HYG84_18015 [Alkaliphilus sp. B6464]